MNSQANELQNLNISRFKKNKNSLLTTLNENVIMNNRKCFLMRAIVKITYLCEERKGYSN